MSSAPKIIRFFLIVFTVLCVGYLAACSHDDDAADTPVGSDKDKNKKVAEVKMPAPICPQVAIVRELQTYRDYGREQPDPSQLVAAGKLIKVVGDCAYTDDGIDVKFELDMAAQRGPRLGGEHTSLPYFIAVLDPQQNILTKNTLSADFDLPDNRKIVEHTDNLHISIPLAKDKKRFGSNYQILIGFQLSQEQLDANRALNQAAPQ